MARTVTLAPPNGVLFVSDISGGYAPEFIPDSAVLSTDNTISVNCLPDVDGETRVTLGFVSEVAVDGATVFDGTIETPTEGILVSTAEREEVLTATVSSSRTRIRIWTNRAMDPDEIVVAWGE